jgi:hypothetical protein
MQSAIHVFYANSDASWQTADMDSGEVLTHSSLQAALMHAGLRLAHATPIVIDPDYYGWTLLWWPGITNKWGEHQMIRGHEVHTGGSSDVLVMSAQADMGLIRRIPLGSDCYRLEPVRRAA